ncbi:MAG: hypothetical protein AABY01_00500 [Nanoarchaeota archaeon]
MDFFDLFKPYSPKLRGDLEKYLRECKDGHADNNFYGPKYYFVMQKNGWLLPRSTWLRVNRSPIPDLAYTVNAEFLLQSQGEGDYNMSCVGAQKGVYDPTVALKKRTWSIKGLNLPK